MLKHGKGQRIFYDFQSIQVNWRFFFQLNSLPQKYLNYKLLINYRSSKKCLTSLDFNYFRPYLVLLQFNFNFMTKGICNLNLDKRFYTCMVAFMIMKISLLTLLWVWSYQSPMYNPIRGDYKKVWHIHIRSATGLSTTSCNNLLCG